MQAISRLSLEHGKPPQIAPIESEQGNQVGGLERRYEFTASGCFVRFVWVDWPPELSEQLASKVSELHDRNPKLKPVQKGSEEWGAISRGWEADPESAMVIFRAFQENFGDRVVSWVKSARDSHGRIGATCHVEGIAEFSLQLSWRGYLITQASLLPWEHWPSFHKASQQILTWAAGRIQPVLDALKKRLAELYGNRFRGIYVFGSYARPDAGVKLPESSDLDVALILTDFENPYEERTRFGDIVADLSLEHGIVISVKVIREDDYKEGKTNFTRVISEYAIPVP